MRTRLGVLMVQQRLAGTDGMPGDKFDAGLLESVVFNNRSYGGELVQDDLVKLFEEHPTVVLGDGTTVATRQGYSSISNGWICHSPSATSVKTWT